jgi:hypothetical protein
MLNMKSSSSNLLNSYFRAIKNMFGTVLPRVTEVNSIFSTDMKNILTLSIALAAAALTLSFLPNVYGSGPEGDSDDRFDHIPGAGVS